MIGHMRILTAAAAFLALLVVPAPAQAAPLPSWVQDETSLANAQLNKTVTALCPGDRVVYGAGGWTYPGGQILMGVVPSADLSSVTVSARQRPGGSGDWVLGARAVCGPAGPYRRAAMGSGSASVGCEGTDIVYSSGFQMLSAGVVRGIVPTLAATEVSATADVAAFAICGERMQSQQRTPAVSALDASQSKLAIAGKPSDINYDWGSAIFGGGILIRDDTAFVDGFTPNATLDAFQARAFKPVLPQGIALRVESADDWDTVVFSTCIGHWY